MVHLVEKHDLVGEGVVRTLEVVVAALLGERGRLG
jgi:hypothetical protein